MTDQNDDNTNTDDGTPSPDDLSAQFAKAVDGVADRFAERIEQVAAAQPPAPVEPAVPAGPSAEDIQRRQTEGLAKYQEMMEAGQYAEAAAYFARLNHELSTAQAAPQNDEDTPAYKALYQQAERGAVALHADAFKSYDNEIRNEIASLPPGERVQPNVWDSAVARVKARHVDEIIESRVASALEQQPAPRTPQAPGSRGGGGGDTVVELDAAQQDAARLLGMSHDEYQKVDKEAEDFKVKRGLHQGMLHLVNPGTPAQGEF